MMEGRHCIVVEEEVLPDIAEAANQAYPDKTRGKGGCHDDAVSLGCDCHGSAGVQAQGCGPEWRAMLSSGHFGMFDGSHFHPHGESSAQTHYRLERSKVIKIISLRINNELIK